MNTNNVFIYALIRRMAFSIAIIGLAFACQKKGNESNADSSSYVTRSSQSGNEGLSEDLESDDYEDEEFECEDENESDVSNQQLDAGTVDETNENLEGDEITTTDDQTDEANEVDNDTENQDAQDTNDQTNQDENQDLIPVDNTTTDEGKGSCYYEMNPCKIGKFRSGYTLKEWPKNYVPLIPQAERTECCDDFIKRAQKEGNEENEVAHKSRKTARCLGVAPNNTSDANCKIKKTYISYFPLRKYCGTSMWGGIRSWFGTPKQARKCILKGCSDKGMTANSYCDRIAVISFGTSARGYRGKYVKWNSANKSIIDNINDFASGKDDQYPKVKLEMVQYFTKTYDPSTDPAGTEYQFNKENKELIDSMKDSKPFIDEDGKAVPYMCERVLKTFRYMCPISDFCGSSWNKRTRNRDAFVFFANDHGCSEHGCTFKYIHNLMCKGEAPKRGIFNTRPHMAARKKVKMKSINCDCKKEECAGTMDFVWRLTIMYRDKEGNIQTHVHENEIDWLYT